MGVFDRHLLRHLIYDFLAAMGVGLIVLTIAQAGRAAGLSPTVAMSGSVMAKAGLLALPTAWAMLSPFAWLFACARQAGRLSADGNIFIMHGFGVSSARLYRPVMKGGLLLALTLLALNHWVSPYALSVLEINLKAKAAQGIQAAIRPGETLRLGEGFKLSASQVSHDGLHDLLIRQKENILMARRGHVQMDAGGDRVRFSLEQGVWKREGTPQSAGMWIGFSRYDGRIDLKEDARMRTSVFPEGWTLTTRKLRRIVSIRGVSDPHLPVQLYRRSGEAAGCFLLGLCGFLMLGRARPMSSSFRLLGPLALMTAYLFLFRWAETGVYGWGWPPFLGGWLPTFALIPITIVLIRLRAVS